MTFQNLKGLSGTFFLIYLFLYRPFNIENMELRKLTLDKVHRELGAKMVPFAGYSMPIQYSSVVQEHLGVRNSVGIFDVSHMGEFVISGPNALDLIQKVCSNDASKLEIGDAQYSYLPNASGGIVDDLIVYHLDNQEFMLVVNASNITKDLHWINSYNEMNAGIENHSHLISLFAVQGPKALDVLQKLSTEDLTEIKYYTFVNGSLGGINQVIISGTGYTGAGGFELYVQNENATELWNRIFEAGAEFGILPIGLGARDTLRIEMGYCLYGNDIDESTSPIQAGLGWVTKFSKSFINDQFLLDQKNNGVRQKLIGFEMIERGIPRKDYEILDTSENVIGRVTSGTQSPVLRKGIGLGYVKKEFAKPGSDLLIRVRKKVVKAQVVKLPFVKKDDKN